MKNFIRQILPALYIVAITQAILIPHPTPWIPIVAKSVPKYHMQLNDNPTDRWREIITSKKSDVQAFVNYFKTYVPVPSFVYKVVAVYAEQYCPNRAYVNEVKAVSDLVEIDFGTMFALNYLYDLTAFHSCTSILVRQSNGQIIHGRNFDFPLMRKFAHLIYDVEVTRNGQLLFIGNGIAGAIVWLNGMKPGKFAITQDTRKSGTFPQNVVDLLTGIDLPAMWLLRKTLIEEETFEGAVRSLSWGRTASPIYYIVSGTQPNQGAVIEKQRFGPHAVYRLNEDRWFLVQTNFDRNIDDPPHDLRRLPAEGRVLNIGQKNFNEQILLDQVLFKYPSLNIGTISTVIINVNTGYLNSTVWWE